jgi:hypothetical protein
MVLERRDSVSSSCQSLPADAVPLEATPARLFAARFAALIAVIGWISLALEMQRSIAGSLDRGHSLGEAIFLFLRFFTIETNIGIACLMTVTAARLFARRAMPSTRVFNAGVIYIIVVCVTYELMLRTQWTPTSMQFFTDFALHDLIAALTLAFWIAYAPHIGARWTDALIIGIYPTAYLAMTLIAGALGETYPYNFFDAGKLGYGRVIVIGLIFLANFMCLSLLATAVSKLRERQLARTLSDQMKSSGR